MGWSDPPTPSGFPHGPPNLETVGLRETPNMNPRKSCITNTLPSQWLMHYSKQLPGSGKIKKEWALTTALCHDPSGKLTSQQSYQYLSVAKTSIKSKVDMSLMLNSHCTCVSLQGDRPCWYNFYSVIIFFYFIYVKLMWLLNGEMSFIAQYC